MATDGRRFGLRGILATVASLLICVGIVGSLLYWQSQPRPVEIAVLGPMSGDYAESGQAMLAAAKLQAKRVNQNGGIDGRPLALTPYDTKSNPKHGRQLANKIADSDAIAAVGAYFSSVSVTAAPVFKNKNMPVVTGSSTAPELVQNNPWYFRVVPDNDSKGRFSALYTDGVLNQKNVSVVYETDAYGKTLARAYIDKARSLGMQIKHRFAVDSSKPATGKRLDKIVARLKKQPHPGALYIGLLGHDAARLVTKLHAANVDLTIIGGDAVGLNSFRQAFSSLKQSDATMAQATNGIFATTYFLPDVANEKAQAFIGAFRTRYQREPRPVAAPNYDAVGMIAAALKQLDGDHSTRGLRDALQKQLGRHHSLTTAYRGITGLLYFNENGGVIKPSTFGMYSRGQLISAPVQLTPAGNESATPPPDTKASPDRKVTMGGHRYDKTNIVYTGIDIRSIRNIDTHSSTFKADFYLWFRYLDASDFNPDNIIFNRSLESVDLGTPVAERTEDGQHYVAYRADATFAADFDFHQFPFDSQTLAIRMRPKDTQANHVKLVPDRIGMRPGTGDTERGLLHHSTAWRLANIHVFADSDSTQSSLGDPHLLRTNRQSHIDYSRLNVLVHVQRLASSYVLSNLAPLFFVLMLGYAMLFVPVEGPPFTARLNLGVIALLTTVSFSLKTSRQLPDISYLTLLDYLYFVVYLMLLYGIASSTLKLHWVKRGYDTRVHRLEWISRVVMPVLLGIAVLIVAGWFARG
ncbi:ABC transporter substrate-binding protein [Salinisphaera sp. USBA-960]|uniref:ABC transporter substrate-binding protein n=1 Tax=Salinisphaera orenii TaxID=856731 RepID=UPI000DBE699F|nr:ABC transporter substrate-binding protein [Salifodinibacter halophilus]NNC25506.1 ABC transporter substrate-binding protein [Salifodinibacter halophilus]